MINIYVRGLHDFSGAYLVYVFPRAHAVLGDPFDFVKVSNRQYDQWASFRIVGVSHGKWQSLLVTLQPMS